jgi:hypothetical protein
MILPASIFSSPLAAAPPGSVMRGRERPAG